MKKIPKPKRAKLVASGGFYKFIPLDNLVAKLQFPVMRRIKLNEPAIDYDATWHFSLVFGLSRVTKTYAEYHQIDVIKVDETTQ